MTHDLQKQSDLLLNADDLDAMWVCLRENCVIDDATGAEKVFNEIIYLSVNLLQIGAGQFAFYLIFCSSFLCVHGYSSALRVYAWLGSYYISSLFTLT